MKKRISLTIDKEIMSDLDKKIDGIIVKSRSDAIEKILRDHLTGQKTAVILAGGDPEKLLLENSDVLRPCTIINGKTTLIEDTISKCREAGYSNIIIVGFTSVISKIYEILGGGEKYKVKIVYIEEKKSLGSAKTLELAMNYIKNDFLFLSSTFYIGFDLRKLAEFHNTYGGVATIGVHARTSYDWKKSIIDMEGHRIISFEENSAKPKTRLAGVLAGFMKPEIFNYIPPGEICWSLQENIFPKLSAEDKLVGFHIGGNWVNVHNGEDVRKVSELIKKQK